jgi:hypothetical protein
MIAAPPPPCSRHSTTHFAPLQRPSARGSVRASAAILVGAGQGEIGTSHCLLGASRGGHNPAWGFNTEPLAGLARRGRRGFWRICYGREFQQNSVHYRGPVTPPAATATTDAAGVAAFMLPAGTYWVAVPRLTSPLPGIPGGSITTELPDGTLVQGWTRVDLAADASADASIRLTVPQP